MAAELIAGLLGANIAAALAIALVLALRIPARRLFGARIAYGLWLIAPLASLAVLAPAGPIRTAPAIAAPLRPIAAAAVETFDVWIAPAPVAATALVTSPEIVAAFWLAGFLASLVLTALAQRWAMSRFGELTPAPGPSRILRATANGLGPALIGAVRPTLVLPADFETRFDQTERRMVLAHEQAHLARGHTRINGLIALAQAVCWFNPLVHVAAFYARVNQELACDAAVVERYPNERRIYGQALLKTQLTTAPLPLGCYWPGRAPNLLKERITMLAFDRPGRLRRIAGATAIAATALTVSAGVWAATPRLSEAPAAPTATPILLAQAPAAGAAAAALGAPAQPKVATTPPAPSVKAGAGGGATAASAPSGSGLDDPDMVAALKLAQDHGFDIYSRPNWPVLQELAKTDPKLAALRLNRLVYGDDVQRHAQTLGWATSNGTADPSRRLSGVLTTADGNSYPIETQGLPIGRLEVAGMAANTDGPSGTWWHGARTNVAEGDNVRVRSSYVLDTGQVIDAPDLTLPLAGGQRVVGLPGGGTLTLAVVPGASRPAGP